MIASIADANGNTLALGERSFGYDGQNRLISATAGAPLAGEHHAASFVYDGHNRQVSRTMDGQTTFFVWDGWSLLAEYQVQGGAPVLVTRYVHGPRQDEIILQQRNVEADTASDEYTQFFSYRIIINDVNRQRDYVTPTGLPRHRLIRVLLLWNGMGKISSGRLVPIGVRPRTKRFNSLWSNGRSPLLACRFQGRRSQE